MNAGSLPIAATSVLYAVVPTAKIDVPVSTRESAYSALATGTVVVPTVIETRFTP